MTENVLVSKELVKKISFETPTHKWSVTTNKLESFQDRDTLIIVCVDSAGLPSIEYCGRAAMFIGKLLHFFD
jgi:hypothetical protein